MVGMPAGRTKYANERGDFRKKLKLACNLAVYFDGLYPHLDSQIRKELRLVSHQNLRTVVMAKHPQALHGSKVNDKPEILRNVDQIGRGNRVDGFSNK
jgi:hypothetical protein